MQPPSSSQRSAEPTRWSPALVCFYLSCAGVALGATFAGGGWFFFGSTVWLIAGGLGSAASIVACYYSLAAARRPLSG